ncbi:hypothetical protein Tco_0294819 [Tanacetum coccineum]
MPPTRTAVPTMPTTDFLRIRIVGITTPKGWELHYLLDKVVSVGTAPGPNNSDHNVNTITNGDGMPRMRTFRENNIPRIKFNKWEELAEELMR